MISRIQSRLQKNSWSALDILRRGHARRMKRSQREQSNRVAVEHLEDRMLLSGTKAPYDPVTVVEGEVLVAIKSDSEPQDINSYLQSLNLPDAAVTLTDTSAIEHLLTIAQDDGYVSAVSLPVAEGTTEYEAVDILEQLDVVAFAEVNTRQPYSPDFQPNDANNPHHGIMNNYDAWDTARGAGIVVAVADTGVDWDHEDLAANIWANAGEVDGDGIDNDGNGFVDDVRGWDFASGDNDPDEGGGTTHGTHVAGIIGAFANNNIGDAGTAFNSQIMPLRIGTNPTVDQYMSAFTYAADNGAHILNTSMNLDFLVGNGMFELAMQYVYDAGVLHIASAGNNAEENPLRLEFDNALFVANTDDSDQLAANSNFGSGIDISAPGESINSTLPGDTYGFMSGSSMAAANAAGAAAVIWSNDPTLTRDQVAALLVESADPLSETGTGSGRVNTARGVSQVLSAPRIDGIAEIASNVADPIVQTIDQITVQTHSVFDPATVTRTNFDLREIGADNVFGTADDSIIAITLDDPYMIGTNDLVISVPAINSGRYRFTAFSGGLSSPFGLDLDGDDDGAAGGNFVQEFILNTNLSFFNVLDADFSTPFGTPSDEGFTMSGQNSEWHVSTDRGFDIGHSAPHSMRFGIDGGFFGSGTYSPNSNGTLTSPIVDLRDAAGVASLSFNHLLNIENAGGFFFDTAAVRIRNVNSGRATTLASTPQLGFGTSNSLTNTLDAAGLPVWENLEFDISGFLGLQIQIEFEFTSDINNSLFLTAEGWFVDDVTVNIPEFVSLELGSNVIQENDGPFATIGTVTRPVTRANQFETMVLTNPDPSEIDIPATIEFVPGQTVATFPITAIDDDILDGTQNVEISVRAVGLADSRRVISVLDHETLDVAINDASISEADGANASTLTVTRSNTSVGVPVNEQILVSQNNVLSRYSLTGQLQSNEDIPYAGAPTPVDRLFTTIAGTSNIIELDPATGDQIDQLTAPRPVGRDDALAFDGEFVWYISSNEPTLLFQLDPETDTIEGQFQLPDSGPKNSMAVLNGLVYISENGLFEQDILVFSPSQGRIIASIDYDGINDVSAGRDLGTGLAGVRNPDRLLVTTAGSGEVLELDPVTGEILGEFAHNLPDVTGLAAFGGNIYISQFENTTGDHIQVFDRNTGIVVNEFSVQNQTGVRSLGGDDVLAVQRLDGENTRDLVVTGDGSIAVFDGTDNPFLNLRSVTTSTWAGATLDGLNVTDIQATGGIASLGNFVYLVDMTLTPNSAEEGLVRFDLSGTTATERFLTGLDLVDVTVGWDGFLYGMLSDYQTVVQINPETMTEIDRLTLSTVVNAIAVNQDGDIFGAGMDGTLLKYDSAGTFITSLPTTIGELIDIDINGAGGLIAGALSGEVAVSTEFLNGLSRFGTPGSGPAYVSYNTPVIAGAGALPAVSVQLINNDPTEVSVPQNITIPAGLSSVTIAIDAVDDFLLDGTQTVSLTATSNGYQNGSDTIDVLDHESIDVDIAADEVFETDGEGATQIVVSRGNIDGPYSLSSTLVEANTTDVTIIDNDVTISQVTVPSQIALVTDVNVKVNFEHDWIGDLDVFLISPSGTIVELFTDIGNNGTAFTETVLDDEAPGSIIDGLAPFTGSFQPESPLSAFDGETVAGAWTLQIRDDNARDTGMLLDWELTVEVAGLPELVVDLSSSDLSEATLPTSVIIPANQPSVVIDLDAVDDAILDGTQTVTVTGTADTYVPESDSVDVKDLETLSLTVEPLAVPEDAGQSAVVARLTRNNSDISQDLVVDLVSGDESEITVQDTVTIPAGQQTTTFFLNAVDDAILDGNQNVVITATNANYLNPAEASIEVIDREQILVLTVNASEVLETRPFVTATIQRKDAVSLANPLVVNLSSSDITEIVPDNPLPNNPGTTQLTIPAGADRVSFKVNVLQDGELDGDQLVTLTATAPDFADGVGTITVLDFETLDLTLTPDTFLENAGENASTLTITRPAGSTGPLTVSIVNPDVTEIDVPATVTIPSGATTVDVPIAAVNDSESDGSQTVILTVSAPGLNESQISVVVQDHEPPVVTSPAVNAERIPEARPTLTWTAVEGAERYDVWINNLSTGENQVIRDANVLETSYTPTIRMANGLYRFWVRAYDGSGFGGPWSTAMNFRVVTPPTITGPVVASNDVTPAITWTNVEGSVHYDLWVRNLTTGRDQVIRQQVITGTTYQITEGLAPGKYKAWVRAFNERIETEDRNRDGQISDDEIFITPEAGNWSRGFTFDVILTPTIVDLPESTFDHTPTIRWEALDGVSHYDIFIRNLSTGEREFLRDRFVTATEFTPETDFPQGNYRVWVRGMNDEFVAGPWSAPQDFSVAGAPVVTSTGDSLTPLFTWTAVDGAESYTFWLNRVGGPARVIVQDVQQTRLQVPDSTPLTPGSYLLVDSSNQ